MTLRVLQLCHDYEGPFVTVCRQYVEGFPEAYVTTVFVQGKPSDQVSLEVGGEAVLFLEAPGENLRGFKFSQIRRLHKLLGNNHYDVVVAHRYKAIYLAGVLSYFRHFKVILGVAHEHQIFQRLTRKLFVTFWRKNITMAGVSQSVVDDIATRCPSLNKSRRLHCLYNALPEAFSNQMMSRGAAREKLGIAADDFVVGSVGRLVRKKSLPTLINAFAELAQSDSKASLVIVGDGPLRSELRTLASELGLTDRIRFLGHVPNAGLCVSAFDVLVLPSGDEEAFGIVLLEAMMSSVPVITSQAKGPSEVVQNTDWQFETGSATDLADKIQNLRALDSRSRAALIADNLRRVSESFSPLSFRQKLAEITESLSS